MLDPIPVFQAAAIAAALIGGLVYGKSRSGSAATKNHEEQMARLTQMQRERIDLLERDREDRIRENKELRERIAHLEQRVAHLEAELIMEKRITARFVPEVI